MDLTAWTSVPDRNSAPSECLRAFVPHRDELAHVAPCPERLLNAAEKFVDAGDRPLFGPLRFCSVSVHCAVWLGRRTGVTVFCGGRSAKRGGHGRVGREE